MTDNVNDAVVELRDLLDQVAIAIRQMVHAGTTAQVAAARGLLINTRRGLYRILADDDLPSDEPESATAGRA